MSQSPSVPPRVRTPIQHGDLPFTIRRDGVWLYQGSPIERKELVCLFASVLRRDADGMWWLKTPAETGRIVVEDAPFIAVEVDWTGQTETQVLSFRTNIDKVVTAGPDHPIRVALNGHDDEPTPYVVVEQGDGAFPIEARINRATYCELVALAEVCTVGDRDMLGVWSRGCFFPLGEVPKDDLPEDDES